MKEHNKREKSNPEEVAVREHKNVLMLRNQDSLDKCRKHGKSFIIQDCHSGDLICGKCGRIICDRMVCEEAEWRNFGDDGTAEKWKRSRIGAAANPLLGDEVNLGTSIRHEGGTDSSNYTTTIRNHYKRRSVDNAISKAFDAIATTASRIHLPESIIFRAQELYSRSYRQLKLKGNVQIVDSKVPACIYIACRLESCSRSSKEIAQISEINTSELHKAVRRVLEASQIRLTPLDTSIMIDRFVNRMDLAPAEAKAIRKKVQMISSQTKDKLNPERCQPETIIGGQIFLALQEQDQTVKKKDLQSKIGSALGISGHTVARSSKLLNN